MLISIFMFCKCKKVCDEVRDRVYGLGQCVLDTPETSALGRADRD